MMRIGPVFAAAVLMTAGCTEQRQPRVQPFPAQFQRVSGHAVVHGERLADLLGCSGCHGSELTGEDWSEPGFGRLWTANLTRAVPAYDDEQLARVIRSGARPDRDLWEMPSHLFTQLTADDMSALIAYLRSVPRRGRAHPEPLFDKAMDEEMRAGTFVSSATQVRREGRAWPPDAGESHRPGRYIVRATCAECHRMDLRGGQPHPGATPRPDLRIAAAYEPEQFRRLLRTGIAAGDRDVGLMSEVARDRYSRLTDAEIDAIHGYLREVARRDP